MVAYDGKSQQCEECKTGGREKIAKSYIVFPYTSLKRLHAQAQQHSFVSAPSPFRTQCRTANKRTVTARLTAIIRQ